MLGALGDPAAVPYLENAVQHGVEGVFHPLAGFGRVESLGTIVETAPAQGFEAYAANPLYFLVLRSNREPEPWMEPKQIVRHQANPELKAKWQAWWQANREGMVLVRSFDEMMAEQRPVMDERSEKYWSQRKRERHFRKYGWVGVCCSFFGGGRCVDLAAAPENATGSVKGPKAPAAPRGFGFQFWDMATKMLATTESAMTPMKIPVTTFPAVSSVR